MKLPYNNHVLQSNFNGFFKLLLLFLFPYQSTIFTGFPQTTLHISLLSAKLGEKEGEEK